MKSRYQWADARMWAAVLCVCGCSAGICLGGEPERLSEPAKVSETVQSTASGKLRALVIGNGAYPAQQLENPAHDAETMSRALEDLGFIVSKHIDLDLAQMEKAIVDFSREVDKDGFAFFFFAGHGIQVKGEIYLIPVDAKIEEEFRVRYESISMESILDALKDSRSNMRVVALDCCRDNPFARSWKLNRSSANNGLGKRVGNEVPEGTLISYATVKGEKAADGLEGNSPYTSELAKALRRRPSKGLALVDVFLDAGRAMKEKTGQRPWLEIDPTMPQYFLVAPTGTANDVVVSPTPSSTKPSSTKPSRAKLSTARPSSPGPLASASGARPTRPPAVSSSTIADPELRKQYQSLVEQAKNYMSQRDYANAIDVYSGIIDDDRLPSALRRQTRIDRCMVYLKRCNEKDLDKAMVDQALGGLAGVQLSVRAESADLKLGKVVKERLEQGQILMITESKGNWLAVKSVDGDASRRGWVHKKTMIKQPKVVTPPAENQEMAATEETPPSRNMYPSRDSGGDSFSDRYIRENGRPPSIWQTPEWESPAEIRQLRAEGRIR